MGDELELPKGRRPKKQIAFEPTLVDAFRYIVRKERRENSDIFKEMIEVWRKVCRPGKYREVKLDDEE